MTAPRDPDALVNKCAICGEPMPPNEQMFKYHGFSGPCPKPPLKAEQVEQSADWWMERADREGDHAVGAVGGAVPMSDLNALASRVHAGNYRWWHDRNGQRLERNRGELLMLVVSEIAEAMGGERRDLMDDHLPHRKMAEVELADAMIRILDYAAGFGYDLHGAVEEKLAYNARRADHTHEHREGEGGKKW